MSGFSGIYLFDREKYDKLRAFPFPETLHGYFFKCGSVTSGDLELRCFNNNKFINDSYLFKDETRVLAFDGVNLSNIAFAQNDSLDSFVNTISCIKGSFSAVYKDEESISVFADQTASRQIFYYWDACFFAFSSSIFLLVDILRYFGKTLSVSEPASYMMLSLGYMLDDYTLISEIKKVPGGQYVRASRDGVTIKKYHSYYRKTIYSKITDDLLAEIDDRFVKAIRLEYEKDLKYSFRHVATLSGGLDSRLNVMFARKCGIEDITCVTYSEGFKSDELTARKISHDLSFRHILFLLNGGVHLYEIDAPLILNNCAVAYFSASHTLAAVKRINFLNYGLFHNGILAESTKGTYLLSNEHRAPKLDANFGVSTRLFSRLDKKLLEGIFCKFENDEMFMTYNRGFNSAHNGSWMTLPYTDSVYTYMDLDLADLAYSIHPKLRYQGYLTVEWINRKNPEQGRYPWHRGIRPTNSFVKTLSAKVLYRLRSMLTHGQDVAFPLNEWFQTNPQLSPFVTEIYDNFGLWEMIPREVQKDIRDMFPTGTVGERLLCISYFRSLELLFTRN